MSARFVSRRQRQGFFLLADEDGYSDGDVFMGAMSVYDSYKRRADSPPDIALSRHDIGPGPRPDLRYLDQGPNYSLDPVM